MRVTRTTLGGLRCVAVQAGDERPELLVVLCHGFGAPGEDLVSLAPELCRLSPALARGARFLFPAAPLSLGFTGFGEGLAWWLIEMERMLAAQQSEEGLAELRAETPEGLPRARRMLREALDVASQQAGLPLSRVVLGGFSQGAMLATDVALRLEEAPAGLAILSGTLLCEPEWRRLAPLRRGLKTFQTHGRFDPLLPCSNAEALRDLLAGAGVDVEFHAFDGQHGIPQELMGPLAAFLDARLR